MAIPWFQGFLGVGLLEFKIRLPDFGGFSLPGHTRSVLPQLISLRFLLSFPMCLPFFVLRSSKHVPGMGSISARALANWAYSHWPAPWCRLWPR